jgi:AcrR family transcriptional regulator
MTHCFFKEKFIRRRRKEARPGELTAAALEVFAEKGFAATRLDDIAARAGVSKGTVYLYFENKEALFKAAVEAAMTPALEAAEALASETVRSAAELLREFVFGWWELVGSTSLGALPRLLVAESGNFPELSEWFHERMISRAQRAMARIIEQGVASGEFRPVDPFLAARIVFAPMFSYVIWQRTFSSCMRDLPAPEIFLSEAAHVLVYGLSAQESTK